MNKYKLTGTAPIFLVRNVHVAANHYRDAMGFEYERFWGEPPYLAILHRDGLFLMLKQVQDPKHVIPHWQVSEKLWQAYFWVSNANALHAEFVQRGATIDYGPYDEPYGCREFGVRDLDGYSIGFGQVIGEPGRGCNLVYSVHFSGEQY